MKYLTYICLIFCLAVNANEKSDLEINLAKLTEGSHLRVEWYGLPVLILKPSKIQLNSINDNEINLSTSQLDTAFQYFAKTSGNIKASILYDSTISAYEEELAVNPYPLIVLLGINPIGGCAISASNQRNYLKDPCRQSTYSLDGRMSDSNGSLPANLFIPPFSVVDDTLIIKAPELVNFKDFSPDIMAMNVPNKTKFWDSISWDKLDVLKELVSKDAALLTAKTSVNCNALHVASGKSPELLSYLISKGVSTTHICDNGYTSLMISLMTRDIQNAKILLAHGAKIDAYCENDNCAKSLKDYLYSDLRYTAEYTEKLIESLKKENN
ncbi:hypothetical protein RGQ13_12935 [Thalassotalea psychrophila]|uniref:Uncharacterized protein n=1 Tax=Thalassotalea psychrophila TaxID=3065647 RepID=A0ABY9TTH1_9GAMM|nr:hypothetical protein RGQ13_12935 [Colwelliaceae bacterium SQ149]